MNRLRITALAAALTAAASLTGGMAAPASAAARPDVLGLIGHGYGTGATSLAAQQAAFISLVDDYYGCGQYTVVYDTMQASGTWAAEVAAYCGGVR